jgi:hypothetical protein
MPPFRSSSRHFRTSHKPENGLVSHHLSRCSREEERTKQRRGGGSGSRSGEGVFRRGESLRRRRNPARRAKPHHSFMWSTSSFRQIPSTPLFSVSPHHHSCMARTSSGSCFTAAAPVCPASRASRHLITAHVVPPGRLAHLPRRDHRPVRVPKGGISGSGTRRPAKLQTTILPAFVHFMDPIQIENSMTFRPFTLKRCCKFTARTLNMDRQQTDL